jgi:GMP synthase (glutamine-hydrolysing)
VSALNELLIIQTGQAPEDMRGPVGDIADWYRRALDGLNVSIRIVRPFLGELLPPPGSVAAAVITGSWAMVSDREGWSEYTATWIRKAMKHAQPLLGICYGHQLMAHALGGKIDYHPGGIEIGVHAVALSEKGKADPFFNAWPAVFSAPLTHMQTIAAMPAGAVTLASSSHDPHQIVRYGRNAISVQFHPEFDASILSACIKRREPQLAKEGFDLPALLAGVTETPYARDVLTQFVRRYVGASATVTQPQAASLV